MMRLWMAILAHLALLGTTLAKTDEVIPETEIDDMEFVKSGCEDSTLADGKPWHDEGAPIYDCAWYAAKPETRCSNYGNWYKNEGMTAAQACCVCRPTQAPTKAPTNHPTKYPTKYPTRHPTPGRRRAPAWCRPSTSRKDAGYADRYRGWYDASGCGRCYDYCRWVGNWRNPNRNPAWRTKIGNAYHGGSGSWWSCRRAGTSSSYSPVGQYGSRFRHRKCSYEGAIPPKYGR